MLTLEDLATLGWETVVRIHWIRNYAQYTRRFKRDVRHELLVDIESDRI